MKITIYELLGLVKDGKAPKKIKYNGKIYVYVSENQDYRYINDIGGFFQHLFNDSPTNDFINDEVEIIEEDKKIEKITIREKTLGFPNGEWTPRNMDKAFAIKINELIDEVNKMKRANQLLKQ